MHAPGRAAVAADAVIARLASRQYRVVTRRQLLAAGVGKDAIQHRVETHRLFGLHRGVYAVGISKVQSEGRWLAAVLACGGGAVLSHRPAAAHLRLLRAEPGPVHVTVPGTGCRPRRGIILHATRSLPRAEVTTRLAVPCTSVERTIIDLAGTEDWATVERTVEQAFALRLLGRTRMRDALDRARGRWGVRRLRRLIHGLLADLPYTRSELECRFLRLVHDAGLPAPVVNRHREGHRVDFAWPRAGLVVETDGRATHDNPYAFYKDHSRDLDLELADWRVIRLSWPQVVNESERVRELLRRRLDPLPVQSIQGPLQ